MCATHNSGLSQSPRRRFKGALVSVVGCVLVVAAGLADRAIADEKARFAAAQEAYFSAQDQFHLEPTNHAVLARFAQVVFERAEFSTNHTERAALAVQGIAAGRKLTACAPKSAAGHYYLALNLGQMARTKLLGALRIVDEMEREFELARRLDEHLDHAGPDRCLGLLYFQAPVLGSVGSRSKARKHLERAVELAPDFPPNRLSLADAWLKWREKQLLRRELGGMDKLWPQALTNYPEGDWLSWTSHRARLKSNAAAMEER